MALGGGSRIEAGYSRSLPPRFPLDSSFGALDGNEGISPQQNSAQFGETPCSSRHGQMSTVLAHI